MTVLRYRFIAVLLVVLMLGVALGCSGRKVATTAGDQASVPGAPPAAAEPPAPQSAQQGTPAEPPPTGQAEPPEPVAAPPAALEPLAEAPQSGDTGPSAETSPSADAPVEAPALTEQMPTEPGASSQPEEVRESVPAPPAGVGETAMAQSEPTTPEPTPSAPLGGEALAASLSDVFFDFDRSVIRPEGRKTLEANARLLKSKKDWQLLIEGHCDERGTVDYNLVLGERRAQSVKRYLNDLGVPEGKVQVVSYGKEKPFCSEHSDACWQQNRRAHFVVK